MKLSRIFLLSLLVLAVVVASFGCQAAQRPEPARYDRTQDGVRGPDRVGFDSDFDIRGVRNNQLNRDAAFDDGLNRGRLGGGMLGLRDNADLMDGGARGGAQDDMTRRLEHRVEQIAGVRDATVVVEGNTVYVALDIDRNLRGQGMTGMGANQARFGQNRLGQDNAGILGQNATRNRGGFFGQDNVGQGNRGGIFGQNNVGQRNQGGFFGRDNVGQNRGTMFGQDNVGLGNRGGFFGRDNVGQNRGTMFGQDNVGQRNQGGFFGQANVGQGQNVGQTADVQQIKQQVRQVLAQEGQFTNFVISEDRTFAQELGGIATEIRTGRPVADFGDALRGLGRTITPTRTR